MAALTTIIGAAGLAVAGYGAVKQWDAVESQNEAIAVGRQGAQQVEQGTRQVEAARKEQDRLNFLRERNRIFRAAQNARSAALSRSVYSGAQYSSSLGGAYGQIAGEEGRQQVALSENLNIGGRIYAGNAIASEGRGLESQSRGMSASASGMNQLGAGLFGLGTSLVNNAPTIQNIGQSAFGTRDTYFAGGYTNTVRTPGLFG